MQPRTKLSASEPIEESRFSFLREMLRVLVAAVWGMAAFAAFVAVAYLGLALWWAR